MFLSTITLMTLVNPMLAATPQQDIKKVEILKIGDLAPDFTVDKWNGGSFKLSDRKDKVAVVTFWNTTMPLSKMVINHLQDLNTRTKSDQPVVWMFVNSGDWTSTYSDWMNKYAGRYAGVWGYDPLGRSTTDNIAWKWYGATSIPTTYVIGTTGRVFAIINGYTTGDNRYRDALRNSGIKVD